MEWFFNPGGEGTQAACLIIFTAGVVVRGAIWPGVILLPSGPIDCLRERLFPSPSARSYKSDPTW